jgi:hypothetical protein
MARLRTARGDSSLDGEPCRPCFRALHEHFVSHFVPYEMVRPIKLGWAAGFSPNHFAYTAVELNR